MFEIKKGVPMPKKASSGAVYNFAGMNVGDCFDAPDDMGKTKNGCSIRQNVMISCSRVWAKKCAPERKFTTRTIKEEGVIRCWRIA